MVEVSLLPAWGAIVHDSLLGQIAGFHKVLEGVLSDYGGNPVTGSGCLWGHCEERSLKRKRTKFAGSKLSWWESITAHIQNGGLKGPNGI